MTVMLLKQYSCKQSRLRKWRVTHPKKDYPGDKVMTDVNVMPKQSLWVP
jgi:hypothetical protein